MGSEMCIRDRLQDSSSSESIAKAQGHKPFGLESTLTPVQKPNHNTATITLPSNASSNTSTQTSQAPDIEILTPSLWRQIFTAIPLSGVVRTVASYCVPINIMTKRDQQEISVEFVLDERNATLFNPDHNERLAQGLSIYFSRPINATITPVADWSSLNLNENDEAPAEYRARMQSEAQGEALDSLKKDQNIAMFSAFSLNFRNLVQRFSAISEVLKDFLLDFLVELEKC